MMTHRLAPFLLLALTAVACSDSDDDGDPAVRTVVDVAREDGSFDTLVGALEAAGLDQALAGEGPFTVFAPTDAAFARLPEGVLDDLDEDTLADILSYHVSPGRIPASTVVTLDRATTLGDDDLTIDVIDGTVVLDGTVQVVTADIEAENGIIHVIDAVLLPPALAFPGTLLDALNAYPRFDTLVTALGEADLASALEGNNDGAGFTLFAPDNQAFAALGLDLETVSQEDLARVLLYHVVGATVFGAEVVDIDEAATLQGASIAIGIDDGSVVLNGESSVTWTDVETKNGVLHVIDTVLLPPG